MRRVTKNDLTPAMVRIMRSVSCKSMQEMADIMGISVNTLRNLERGIGDMNGEVAEIFVEVIQAASIDVELDDQDNLVVTLPKGFY